MQERGPIQLSPPGLLNLLQLKAEGRSIQNLGDTCIPSLEMSTWWLRAATELWPNNSGLTLAAGVSGVFTPYSPNDITVPNGQWWYVHHYGVQFQTAAANNASNVRLAWAANATGTIRWAALPDEPNQQVGNATILDMVARDFWLPPGARLGFTCDTVTGAVGLGATVTLLRFTRLPS